MHGAVTRLVLCVACLMIAWPVQGADVAPSVQRLVERTDQLRQIAGSTESTIALSEYKGTVELQKKSYRLRADGQGRVLMDMLDPGERGQKILSIPEGLWMYFPNTRRPIRLTPSQLLVGRASIGDVFRGSWAQEYEAQAASPPRTRVGNDEYHHLILTAKTIESTYGRIELFVRVADHNPVRAELYSVSGRLLKTVRFEPPKLLHGRELITVIWFSDEIDRLAQKETRYQVNGFSLVKLPPSTFSLRSLEVGP